METKIIYGVYNEPEDIKPIGTALLDENGELMKCESCNEGIAFIEWETRKTRCTRCTYIQ